ncbi:MAG: ABC transporter ATP-binding protein [Melioribacteraceae bacterium]|nr:ABC transporter ATP-binding protein [Melioribacteraceae bacterium]MCO6472661.1 ABC transporter ATP-binding protein [Melioribacteraceae bacterium]MDD3558593.1 ABC transporter ATP-binding protein [Melioribacteraceae bacterium]
MIILKSENIHKSFFTTEGVELKILKGIDFELEKNKVTMIAGKSGSGKSTLLHILSGLDMPDKGNVEILGENIFDKKDKSISEFRNKHIGFVFQFHQLLGEFTAEENVAIPMILKGISLPAAKKDARKILDLVGLSDRASHKPAQLSGGEQQRVAVARAIANYPEIIFADEPTGNLDSENSAVINSLLLELKEKFNITLLIVTHNLDLLKLADKIYEMKDGILHPKEL